MVFWRDPSSYSTLFSCTPISNSHCSTKNRALLLYVVRFSWLVPLIQYYWHDWISNRIFKKSAQPGDTKDWPLGTSASTVNAFLLSYASPHLISSSRSLNWRSGRKERGKQRTCKVERYLGRSVFNTLVKESEVPLIRSLHTNRRQTIMYKHISLFRYLATGHRLVTG